MIFNFFRKKKSKIQMPSTSKLITSSADTPVKAERKSSERSSPKTRPSKYEPKSYKSNWKPSPKSPMDSKRKQPEKIADPKKEFLSIFHQLTYRYSPWSVWQDFVFMFGCSISNAVDKSHFDEREAIYMRIIKKYGKKEQFLFPELVAQTVMALDLNQEQDFFGEIYQELKLRNESKAQYFTPYNVCQLMAEITLNDIHQQVAEKGYITINDPACGAGANLIAGVHVARRELEKDNLNYQNHVMVVAQDIDDTVALMGYIQLSLLGIAGYVKIGNTLTEPIATGDSLENYWFTPMYFSEVWSTRRFLRSLKTGDSGLEGGRNE